MAAIRSHDTKPEMLLRRHLRMVGATGYRCHLRSLPGRPDIAFTRHKLAVFVDGAFWHGHEDYLRPHASPYWATKIERNRARDREADRLLNEAGWTVLRLWDFEVMAAPEAHAIRIGAIIASVRLQLSSA